MKTILKNKKNKIITLVIVLISMISVGFFMQSCSQEDESTELDIFKDLPFLSFSRC
jgi:hypothetical protein